MSAEIKLQAGQWYRRRDGEIVFCLGFGPGKKMYPIVIALNEDCDCIEFYKEDGTFSNEFVVNNYDIIEHLPDCTGFDWVPTPKLHLREGAWYERADGKIVGPCRMRTGGLRVDYRWDVSGELYHDDGTQRPIAIPGWCLVREVEPPQPKYRAFRDREEAFPFCDGWWLDDGEPVRITRVRNDCVFVGGRVYSFDMAFASLKRHDGSPFGVLDAS